MTKTSKTEQSKRLKKVAKQLGVSYASISRSFNTEPTNNSLRDGSLHGITVVPGAREAALQEAASQEAAARACGSGSGSGWGGGGGGGKGGGSPSLMSHAASPSLAALEA